MNYKNKKNFGFVTLSFHIARNKNCFSRYDGIKPVLAAGRFSLFASLYLFTCFRWKFRNRTERNCGRKMFSSRNNYNFHLPTKNKTKSMYVLKRKKVWRHELLIAGSMPPSVRSNSFVSPITVRTWKRTKYSFLLTVALDGKRLPGWKVSSHLIVESTSKYKFAPISCHSPMVFLF